MTPTMSDTGPVRTATFTRRFFGDMLLEGLLLTVTLIIGWLIWLYFTAKTSQTPAKRLLNVYILDNDMREPVGAARVWIREVLVKVLLFSVFNGFTFGIAGLVNPIWALFDDERQALHDKVSGTVVAYAPDGLPGSSKADGRPAGW